MLGTKHSADSLEYFSYFSQKIDSNFKEIVSLAENLHEMLKLIFSKKKTNKKKKKKKNTQKKKKKNKHEKYCQLVVCWISPESVKIQQVQILLLTSPSAFEFLRTRSGSQVWNVIWMFLFHFFFYVRFLIYQMLQWIVCGERMCTSTGFSLRAVTLPRKSVLR